MKFNYTPFLIVVSSPSGAGKSTICGMIVDGDKKVKLSTSATTRPKRSNEIEGKHYFFKTDAGFDEMISKDEFLEYADVFLYKYGTPRKMVEDELSNGNDVLFDIDWQGARFIREKFPSDRILSIFILPPSIEELERRLRNRAQDSEETLKNRMLKAKDEIRHFDEYDHVLINDNIDEVYSDICTLIEAKRISVRKKEQLNRFVSNNLLNEDVRQ